MVLVLNLTLLHNHLLFFETNTFTQSVVLFCYYLLFSSFGFDINTVAQSVVLFFNINIFHTFICARF